MSRWLETKGFLASRIGSKLLMLIIKLAMPSVCLLCRPFILASKPGQPGQPAQLKQNDTLYDLLGHFYIFNLNELNI